jgi:hypothetical protein
MPQDIANTEWAAQKIAWVRRWAILYWTLYTWFATLSWVVAILVPVGSAIMLYVPEDQRRFWNVVILSVGGAGLVLQVLASVLRLRERALRGRRNANKLEAALLKHRAGLLSAEEFCAEITHFLEEDYQEEGP